MSSHNDSFAASGSSPTHAPDFQVENHGSIFLLIPQTAASVWISEHIPDDAQWFGDAVAVEHRYIGDIVRGIQNDGFMVS